MSDNHNTIEDFPPLDAATPDGLLAMGGDLSPQRLLKAYSSGIFPWNGPNEPILWWSPDPRCVIFPDEFEPSRSLRKSFRNGGFAFTMDTAFEQTIQLCAEPRPNQPGTWITPSMESAYISLHQLGYAHSAEVWHDGELVGGLYGIAMGGIFFGESMFSRKRDASKIALWQMIELLKLWQFDLIDCQVSSHHLMNIGATEIPRQEFVERLQCSLKRPGRTGSWSNPSRS